eukprot:197673-Rhodomonas_salina.3
MDSLSDASHTRKPQELWAIPLCWKGCFWELISAHSRLTLRRPSDDSVVLRVGGHPLKNGSTVLGSPAGVRCLAHHPLPRSVSDIPGSCGARVDSYQSPTRFPARSR